MMDDNEQYQSWLEQRRQEDVPEGFSDRVMAAVERQHSDATRQQLLRRLVLALVASRLGKFAACCIAFVIGTTPFLYYLAQLIGGSSSASGLTG